MTRNTILLDSRFRGTAHRLLQLSLSRFLSRVSVYQGKKRRTAAEGEKTEGERRRRQGILSRNEEKEAPLFLPINDLIGSLAANDEGRKEERRDQDVWTCVPPLCCVEGILSLSSHFPTSPPLVVSLCLSFSLSSSSPSLCCCCGGCYALAMVISSFSSCVLPLSLLLTRGGDPLSFPRFLTLSHEDHQGDPFTEADTRETEGSRRHY